MTIVTVVSTLFWWRDAVLTAVTLSSEAWYRRPAFIVHGVAVGFAWCVMVMFTLPKVAWSTRGLRMLDAMATMVLLALYALVAWLMSSRFPRAGNLLGVLVTGTMLMTRAIVVPEVPHRAAAFNVVACVPLILMAYYQRSFLAREGVGSVEALLTTSMWAGAFVLIASVAQHVIHGLRRSVREARQLGQYTLEELVGEGGMGQVFKARHAMLRRPTAVKLLPPERLTPAQVARFDREAQLTAELKHPNTISVYDYGRTPEGVFYYAMEFLEGVNLEELVEDQGPQPPERVIHMLRQVCGALAEAHGVGLIHRDIKPANIFLTVRGGEYDVVKVLDFGLVMDLNGSSGVDVTDGGVLTGTPLYMAPESIASRERIDARADLYSLGAVGYYLLTGEPVFSGDSVIEVCAAHLHEVPVPPREHVAGVPRDLETVVMECLAKSPVDRPASALALKARLDACGSAGRWSEQSAEVVWSRRSCVESNGKVSTPKPMEVDLTRRAPAA